MYSLISFGGEWSALLFDFLHQRFIYQKGLLHTKGSSGQEDLWEGVEGTIQEAPYPRHYVEVRGHIDNPEHDNCTRVYPKVSGLAAWSENWKWYGSMPLGAVVSLFCESV
jgi:hypothetical protein